MFKPQSVQVVSSMTLCMLSGFHCLLLSLDVQSSESTAFNFFQSFPTVFGGCFALPGLNYSPASLSLDSCLPEHHWNGKRWKLTSVTGFGSAELVTRGGSRRNGCQLWLASLGVLDSIPGVQCTWQFTC